MFQTGPNLAGFSGWIKRVLATMKAENDWGITRVAKEGAVSRALLTNWRDGNWSQGKPTRETVERFCDNLKLSKEEPFGYLGYSLSPRESAQAASARVIAPETREQLRIRRIQRRLAQKPPDAERRELEIVLVQLLAAERMQADAVAAAEEVLKRHGIEDEDRSH